MKITELDALYALLVAAGIAAVLTPLTMRLALRVGAVDQPRERGLSSRATPLLGGLAIFGGALVSGLIFLPGTRLWNGVLIAAGVITVVGALDDRFDLPPVVKLAGQIAAALIAVHAGVVVHLITLPFVGALHFPNAGGTLTTIGLVGLMNIVNFSDGVDGLAAGVCMIIAAALAVIAFDLQRTQAGGLAALTAGAALGFLLHNFPPASSFMGDCGSNLLGLLMGVLTVEGTVKTPVVVSFALPLILLAVPFLDTTFVVLKRLKYHQPVYKPDSEHFHHRMARIGFSPRRTVFYLYGWTLMLAGLALALRFVPYSDHHGHLHTGWSIVVGGLGVIVAAASIYLIYVLEILKFKRLATLRERRLAPDATDLEIEASVTASLETGEFDIVQTTETPPRGPTARTRRASPLPEDGSSGGRA
ncbi:MAG TPA: MraY family glycosyltransferase [Solirubrobacteraceae bacterium]|jgi:UDP-GlcNAc:undecaprenyl-phosphate GlcNAc-1-phosphate transferase|nr:MraY family glycosyltransferase [Solirubrobacteraceae bacterium]